MNTFLEKGKEPYRSNEGWRKMQRGKEVKGKEGLEIILKIEKMC